MLEIDEDAEIALLETEWWVGFCLKKLMSIFHV